MQQKSLISTTLNNLSHPQIGAMLLNKALLQYFRHKLVTLLHPQGTLLYELIALEEATLECFHGHRYMGSGRKGYDL